MSTLKKIFKSTVSEMNDDFQTTKKVMLNYSNKRNVWNTRRRYSY
ncbi:MAG TPA: hypothetical protein VFD80_03625 [Flavobacteriaceae bacterium]|nr:hypothetical protein [Flavobacteriaceae bacterium]